MPERPRVDSRTTNAFDKSLRQGGIDFIDFNNQSTENNSYKPALIQKEQDNLTSKVSTHFIHKKQSQCNIKRTSGVSYIKPSESRQQHVRDNYEKLPPIVIQGSYHLPKSVEPELHEAIAAIVQEKLFSETSHLLITSFESSNEVSMKNYILKPHKRI